MRFYHTQCNEVRKFAVKCLFQVHNHAGIMKFKRKTIASWMIQPLEPVATNYRAELTGIISHAQRRGGVRECPEYLAPSGRPTTILTQPKRSRGPHHHAEAAADWCSGRSGRNCPLFPPVISDYKGPPDTHLSREITRLMSWPDGKRYTCPLQSLVIFLLLSLVSTLLFFSDWRRTVSSKFFDTQVPSISNEELVLLRHTRCALSCLRCNGPQPSVEFLSH